MEKILKNYKTNLIILFICYVVAILFNTHLFTIGSFIHILYGLAMIVLGGLTLYCLILVNKDVTSSAKIATIVGPIMSIIAFVEGFMYGKGFIVNFRVVCLFMMIGGILIFNAGRKIKKNNF